MDITQHHQCERIQSPYTRRNIPDDSSDEHGSFRECGYYNERGRPLEKQGTQIEVEDLPGEKNHPV